MLCGNEYTIQNENEKTIKRKKQGRLKEKWKQTQRVKLLISFLELTHQSHYANIFQQLI
jgi:hypothetical protein